MIKNLLNKLIKKKQQPVVRRYSPSRIVPMEGVVESVSEVASTLVDSLPLDNSDEPKVHVEPPAPVPAPVPTHTKPLDYHTTPAENPEPSHHHDSHHVSHDSGGYDGGGYDSGGSSDCGGCDGGGGGGGD